VAPNLPPQTFLVTDDARQGSATFAVTSHASTAPLGPPNVQPCTNACVIVATLGGDFGFASAPISFVAAGTAPSDQAVIDGVFAVNAVDRYEQARATGNYLAAWGLMGDEMATTYGGLAGFVTDAQTYLADGAGPYTVALESRDEAQIRTLLGSPIDGYAASADLSRASEVVVHHPAINVSTPDPEEHFVVAPVDLTDPPGERDWRVWLVLDPPNQVQPVCEDPSEFSTAPALTCQAAVPAALARLPAGHAEVMELNFHFGTWCPEGARCAAAAPDRGYVLVQFLTGDPMLVPVIADRTTGVVTAGDPEPYPPTP
jgi:hypothetical protein